MHCEAEVPLAESNGEGEKRVMRDIPSDIAHALYFWG